ncbi:hypothetical protein DFH06DRAFT_1215271 [Mycena polygramma]|nr:hypothetical protein DFH06DRAFT_1215271 [Mycena polygramma]
MTSEDLKPLPPCNPQLPQHLWKRFKTEYPHSIIFSSNFTDARHRLVTGEMSAKDSRPIPGFILDMPGREAFLNLEPGWLHIAVMFGDPPLACEMLRLGCPIQSKDRRNHSAVYFGCAWVENYMRHGKWKDRTGKTVVPDEQILELMKHYSQMLKVCIFLVEQHSDPNEMHKGVSILHLACLIGSWDLIRALLLHGAKPSNDNAPKMYPIDTLETLSDKANFTALVSQYSTQIRPPRPCPCASGRTLSECHATDQPYPGEYLCPCCSRKTHAKCCEKRIGFTWHEIWTEETQFDFVKKIIQPMKFADPEEQADFIAKVQSMSKDDQRDLIPTVGEARDTIQRHQVTVQLLARSGKIDRAFAKAAEKTGYLPRPGWNEVDSKIDGKVSMSKWNQAVDDYITSGVDHRGRRVIENAAKIGSTGGPLFRRCEANGCANVEGRESVKLLLCSGCKTAVYCGKSCQKNTWISHRLSCRSGTVNVQALPSQLAYIEAVAHFTGVDLSHDKKALRVISESIGVQIGG